MIKIAVMGDAESIKGFAAVGLEIHPCEGREEAASTLKKLAAGEYGIIYVTEYLTTLLAQEIAQYDESLTPAIIPIPGLWGNTGIGTKRLSAAVEQAVGSDIIFEQSE